jgi:hypothetical protein
MTDCLTHKDVKTLRLTIAPNGRDVIVEAKAPNALEWFVIHPVQATIVLRAFLPTLVTIQFEGDQVEFAGSAVVDREETTSSQGAALNALHHIASRAVGT